jgi:hypothetical protein
VRVCGGARVEWEEVWRAWEMEVRSLCTGGLPRFWRHFRGNDISHDMKVCSFQAKGKRPRNIMCIIELHEIERVKY